MIHYEARVRFMEVFHSENPLQGAEALFLKGCRLQQGDGVPRDPDAAVRCYREAAAAGVQVLAVDCTVTEDSMRIRNFVPVKL